MSLTLDEFTRSENRQQARGPVVRQLDAITRRWSEIDIAFCSSCSGLGALVTLGDAGDDAAIVVECTANHQALLGDVVLA